MFGDTWRWTKETRVVIFEGCIGPWIFAFSSWRVSSRSGGLGLILHMAKPDTDGGFGPFFRHWLILPEYISRTVVISSLVTIYIKGERLHIIVL